MCYQTVDNIALRTCHETLELVIYYLLPPLPTPGPLLRKHTLLLPLSSFTFRPHITGYKSTGKLPKLIENPTEDDKSNQSCFIFIKIMNMNCKGRDLKEPSSSSPNCKLQDCTLYFVHFPKRKHKHKYKY